MLKKHLYQLLKGLDCRVVGGDVVVSHITNDSRQVQPGSLFFAIKGYRDDGGRYINDAIKAGAAALVTETAIAHCPIPQVIAAEPRRCQSAIACNFFDNPGRELVITGITGTNGKSTTTLLVDSILRAEALRTGVMGTLYAKLDEELRPARHTTPDSIECQGLLRQMAQKGVSHVTMEVSSHAMVMDRVSHVPFAAGGLTNFSPDHLDLHRDMEDYFQAKKKFFDLLSPDSIAVVNADDKYSAPMVKDCKARIITYGIEEVADIMLVSQGQSSGGQGLEIAITRSLTLPRGHTLETGELDTELHLPGRHNIYNALLAASIALGLGTSPAAVSAGIARFQGLFRRCEEIWNGSYRVIDDATHNPGNMNAVFETVADSSSKYVVVYGIRGSRGADINRDLASTLGNWSHKLPTKQVIVTKCTDTASPADAVTPEEARTFTQEILNTASCKTQFAETLREAVAQAVQAVEPGDTLLLLGAHPMDGVAEIFAQEAGVEIKVQPRPPAFGS